MAKFTLGRVDVVQATLRIKQLLVAAGLEKKLASYYRKRLRRYTFMTLRWAWSGEKMLIPLVLLRLVSLYLQTLLFEKTYGPPK